jgi:hypothetical protein
MSDSGRTTPSTAWTESIPADEAERFTAYARELSEVQRRKSERYGVGRTLHRKQLLGLTGTLAVLPDLPDHAAHGLFANPGSHDVLVRLSNGGVDRAKDATPDIRGFALNVRGVSGPGALGSDTTAQDFLLINHATFAIGNADDFVGLVVSSSKGRGALVRWAIGRFGLRGGLARLRGVAASLGRPFSGFATETFWSAAPIACGPYAVRVRLVPVDPAPPTPDAAQDWATDVVSRLASGPLAYDLQLQFFTDAASTPIEDASVDWPTPYVTVARLTVPAQERSTVTDDAAETAAFDPWCALADHRPLGSVMRARKAAYRPSQTGRGLA